MGLIVNVYRLASGSDCTNGGVSSKCDELTVVNIDGPFEPTETRPAVKLVKGPMNTVRIVPVNLLESGVWVMFGGNIASTSDSRFNAAINDLIGYSSFSVGIFDRVE